MDTRITQQNPIKAMETVSFIGATALLSGNAGLSLRVSSISQLERRGRKASCLLEVVFFYAGASCCMPGQKPHRLPSSTIPTWPPVEPLSTTGGSVGNPGNLEKDSALAIRGCTSATLFLPQLRLQLSCAEGVTARCFLLE